MKPEVRPTCSIWRIFVPWVLVIWGTGGSLTAHAIIAAMVTDLQGRASIGFGGRTVAATIASEIETGAQVQVQSGSTLVALYLTSGTEYVFKGPAQVTFGPQQPEVLTGAPAVLRGPATANPIRIKPVGMSQSAMVMRSSGAAARIRLLSASGTTVVDTRPEFHWQEPHPGLKYQVEIADDTGRLLHESTVDGALFMLPAGLHLKEGMSYTWSVSTRLPDGRKYSSIGDFGIANAELRSHAVALRPAADAELSQWVVYAIWLDQIGLKDEARKRWRALSAERADDERLKQLADR